SRTTSCSRTSASTCSGCRRAISSAAASLLASLRLRGILAAPLLADACRLGRRQREPVQVDEHPGVDGEDDDEEVERHLGYEEHREHDDEDDVYPERPRLYGVLGRRHRPAAAPVEHRKA